MIGPMQILCIETVLRFDHNLALIAKVFIVLSGVCNSTYNDWKSRFFKFLFLDLRNLLVRLESY